MSCQILHYCLCYVLKFCLLILLCANLFENMDTSKPSENKSLKGTTLSITEDRRTRNDSKTWNSSSKGPDRTLRRSDSETGSVLFEIPCTRTIDDTTNKRYVGYTIVVKKIGLDTDAYPAKIERRYTEFLLLYMSLRQAFPTAFTTYYFPKKLLTGNFSPEVIAARSVAFETLLSLIAANHKVRESTYVTAFILNKELAEVKTFIKDGQYNKAIPIVENSFRLLNKIYTDRHPSVIRLLCLLVACCDADNHSKSVIYADVALHRYEAISDADLLRYYVSLLQVSGKLYADVGKDNSILEKRLSDFKRRGIKVNGLPSLLEAVMVDLFSLDV